jgi:ankyrin repeat protein
MPQTSEYRDYCYVLDVLSSGDTKQFEELAQLVDGFPNGVDGFVGRRWVTNAIDCCSRASIEWMLSKKVDLSFRDDEGYTVLHSALERDLPEKYEILESLLLHGAPVNAHGINDWTPTHMAAARNDVAALRLLIRFGADLTIRTHIDDCATPLEEARIMKQRQAVEFLESVA